MGENMKQFKSKEKSQKLDVHEVLIQTGKNEVDDTYFLFIKSLNNPLLRGKVLIGKDEDLLNDTFESLDDKDKVYGFIENAYKEFTAQKLSKVYADEREVRDEERIKDTVEFMKKQEAEMAAAAEEPPAPEEEPPEETEEDYEIIGHKDQLLNDKLSFKEFYKNHK